MRHARHILAAVALLGAGRAHAQYGLEEAFPGLPAFSLPIELVHPRDGTDRLFVVEQRGRIHILNSSIPASTPRLFLNISDIVSTGGGETGLLGLAFHPLYASNGFFYVNYTSSRSGSLKSYVSRFSVSSSNPDSALKGSEVVLLTADQPYENHNGGKTAFGPDGYLYIALGDGGSGNDPFNNGQSLTTLLGKILRIDVDTASAPLFYGIPSANPFAGNMQGYREEIYAYGLRNPWKFSFDTETGTLWAGDVGQGAREEIDTIMQGGNYGWRLMEGTLCTPGVNPTCQDTAGLLRPVWEYDRSAGDVSVTGGYVYRGTSIPGLRGRYIFADFASGRIWALTTDGVNPARSELLVDSPYQISTFGVDSQNELYVAAYGAGTIFRLTGPATSVGPAVYPLAFGLEQNYPNPFNPSTEIRFRLAEFGPVRLSVYDLLGREVAVLVDEARPAGNHAVTFDAAALPSGIYVYRLTAGRIAEARRMLLLK
jgi:glucose/arabinose dehydrogenase